MYKLLILDDEYLVRRGLSETIDWQQFDIEIIGEATNGRDGLKMALELLPDIIISDVKMPIMDGKDFIKALKEYQLDTICIMLSGYKDFEYAKSTLESGAFAYLLKPISNQKLLEVITLSIEELNKRRHNQQLVDSVTNDLPLIKTTILQNLLAGNFNDIYEIESKNKLYNLQIPIEGYLIYVKLDNVVNSDATLVKEALMYIYQLIEKTFNYNFEKVIYYSHLIIFSNDLPSKEKLFKIINEEIINDYEKKYDILISIAISDKYYKLEEIKQKYLILKKLIKNKVLLTLNTITFEDDQTNNYRYIVLETIKYIANNYRYNLDIETMSRDLSVSPSHLMHTFKEDVGKTINEYLTEYRVAIAKQLLIQGKLKIYEISEKVGYTDAKYFSQVFKKITGLTPQEYQILVMR